MDVMPFIIVSRLFAHSGGGGDTTLTQLLRHPGLGGIITVISLTRQHYELLQLFSAFILPASRKETTGPKAGRRRSAAIFWENTRMVKSEVTGLWSDSRKSK